MIPVQLTIKGFYSYIKSETIDFQPLVDAKLFGIFGPVGSGKSAILEAIMFVLFDRSTRLNKAGDDRYYNMMNLQSNEMIIDFIFKSGRNHKNKFRFYFMARRKVKDFQKVEVQDRSYYQWSKDQWKPLKKPDVLGMTYENFMQTVIIPQGKFSEFIDQKPAARTQMLKELFHMDRFDIAPQAYRLLGTVKEQINFLDGQLSQYTEVNQNLLRHLDKEVEGMKEVVDKKVLKEQKLIAEIGKMQLLQHIFNELVEVSESLDALISESDFYQEKQHQLDRFVKVQELFRDKILQQRQLLLEAKSKREELGMLVKEIHRLEQLVARSRQQWTQAQTRYADKDHMLLQIADLELLIQLKSVQDNFENIQSHWEQVQKEIVQLTSKTGEIQLKIERSRVAATRKSEALEELQRLTILKEWWAGSLEKEKQLDGLVKEQLHVKKEINSLLTKINDLKDKTQHPHALKKSISAEREKFQLLRLQDDWRTHARLLEEGKPCPLCGATSHPKPLSESKLSDALDSARKNLKGLEEMLERQHAFIQQSGILETKIDEKQEALINLTKRHASIQKDLKKHRANYPGPDKAGNRPPNLDQTIEKLEKIVMAAKKEQSLLDVRLLQGQEILTKQTEKQETLQQLALRKEKLEGKIDQMTKMIKILEVPAFLQKTEQQLNSLIEQMKEKLKSAELSYNQSFDNLTKSDQQLNHQKGLLQSLEMQVTAIKTNSSKLDTELIEICKRESFKGLKEVQRILALGLNVAQERRELEKYHTDLNALKVRKKGLRIKIGRKQYQEIRHHELVQEQGNLTTELHQLRHQLSSKQHTQQQMQLQLQKKTSLAKELQHLSVRKDHIQEISNLLRGNGFINFISSVYLQNLCKAANARFTKLTGNRLSLELNEYNEFMVRDYLNDGKLRLLKTLSGGQIFQASLCLALSLAENVKILNQADQSFFFLDEGFGALDRPSLQLVFETLKSLQKENRIVGIISHVEELQLEIDTYLSVHQEEDSGSTISRSWEAIN